MSVTYYVALPFIEDDEVELKPGEAQEAQTAMAAIARAATLAQKHAGAIAFSRTADPGLGEFEPAVILARYGRTSEELERATRAAATACPVFDAIQVMARNPLAFVMDESAETR